MKDMFKAFEAELKPVGENDQTKIIALIQENTSWIKLHGMQMKIWMNAQILQDEKEKLLM